MEVEDSAVTIRIIMTVDSTQVYPCQ